MQSVSKQALIYTYLTSLSVFVFAAIALIIPTGYSWGSGLLLLCALANVYRKDIWKKLENPDWLIVVTLAGFFLAWAMEIILHNLGSREFDKPSRFIAAILVLPFLLTYPPRPQYFWAGVITGATLTGLWSAWQTFAEGDYRAGGHTQLIQFGNISMLFGLICLAGLGWAQTRERAALWSFFLLAGFTLGVAASFLSGSRGGWLALPVSILIMYFVFADYVRGKKLVVGLLLLSILGSFSYYLSHSVVSQRLTQASNEFHEYLESNDASTSVGARLEMWKGAALIALQKPVLGWGELDYQRETARLVKEGRIDPFIQQFSHAHNEVLDTWAKRGVIGVIALLGLYIMPIILFRKGYRSASPGVRAYSLAGAILCTAYFCFGLTQVFFSHNSGVMIYSFMLVILWSLYRRESGISEKAP